MSGSLGVADSVSITDAQVHIWGADHPSRPWPTGHSKPHRLTPITADDVIAEMDGAGVARAVIVPPSWEGDRNDVALQAASDHPDRFAVMGRIDLRAAAGVDLAHWRANPGMLGARVTFHLPDQRSWLTDGMADWFWTNAEHNGLPVMVFAPGQNQAIDAIARAHPELRLIIDHLNLATGSTASAIGPAVEGLLPLSERPNVAVKISALPCFVPEAFPFPGLVPHLRRVISTFGASRCMWGSDLSRLSCPYRDWIRAIVVADFLSATDKASVLGGSISEWLDWPDA